MYAGDIVEEASVDELFDDPRHPYTLGLICSRAPRWTRRARNGWMPIEGLPPDLVNLPPGCPFHPRCRYACDRSAWSSARCCAPVEGDHTVACWVDVDEAGARAMPANEPPD